jgi:hypothetical protein
MPISVNKKKTEGAIRSMFSFLLFENSAKNNFECNCDHSNFRNKATLS